MCIDKGAISELSAFFNDVTYSSSFHEKGILSEKLKATAR